MSNTMGEYKSQELEKWLNASLYYKLLSVVRDRYLILYGMTRFFKTFYPIFLVLGSALYFLLSNI